MDLPYLKFFSLTEEPFSTVPSPRYFFLTAVHSTALEKTAYALSLAPDDKSVDAFLARLESATGMKRPAPKPGPKRDQLLEDTLTRASAALEESRYEDAILYRDDG